MTRSCFASRPSRRGASRVLSNGTRAGTLKRYARGQCPRDGFECGPLTSKRPEARATRTERVLDTCKRGDGREATSVVLRHGAPRTRDTPRCVRSRTYAITLSSHRRVIIIYYLCRQIIRYDVIGAYRRTNNGVCLPDRRAASYNNVCGNITNMTTCRAYEPRTRYKP